MQEAGPTDSWTLISLPPLGSPLANFHFLISSLLTWQPQPTKLFGPHQKRKEERGNYRHCTILPWFSGVTYFHHFPSNVIIIDLESHLCFWRKSKTLQFEAIYLYVEHNDAFHKLEGSLGAHRKCNLNWNWTRRVSGMLSLWSSKPRPTAWLALYRMC